MKPCDTCEAMGYILKRCDIYIYIYYDHLNSVTFVFNGLILGDLLLGVKVVMDNLPVLQCKNQTFSLLVYCREKGKLV